MLFLRPFSSSSVLWAVSGSGFLPLSLCQCECDSAMSYTEKLIHTKTFFRHIFHLGKFLSPDPCSVNRAVAWKGLVKLSGGCWDWLPKHSQRKGHFIQVSKGAAPHLVWVIHLLVSLLKLDKSTHGCQVQTVTVSHLGWLAKWPSWTCSLETDPCSEKWGTDCRGWWNLKGCPTFCASLQLDQLEMT